MGLIPRHYLYRLVDSVLDPRLFWWRRQGLIVGLYRELDQPWLRALNIRTVLDVGANVGRFAVTARKLFPDAQIYAFDPLQDCLDQASAAMRGDRAFTTINAAVGDEVGTATFQRNAASASSSLLPMTRRHTDAYPGTERTTEVSVRLDTLDRIAASHRIDGPIFIKVDVQGFEGQVLRGASETLARTSVVLLESSFETLYEGQALFDDLYDAMASSGFEFRGNFDQAHHPRDGRLLQADSLFVRRGVLR